MTQVGTVYAEMKRKRRIRRWEKGVAAGLVVLGIFCGGILVGREMAYTPDYTRTRLDEVKVVMEHRRGDGKWERLMEMRGENLGLLRVCAPSTETGGLNLRLVVDDGWGKGYPIYF